MNDLNEISAMRYHNDLVVRVLDRHNITQDQLARQSQVDKTSLSRMLSGVRTLSPEVLRGLWSLTRDPEILLSITGDHSIVMTEPGDDKLDITSTTHICILRSADMLQKFHQPIHDDDQVAARVADIDRTISGFHRMRELLIEELDQSQPTPQQRTGSQLDFVA